MGHATENTAPNPDSRRFLRPGFDSLDVIPVGKYIIKISTSHGVVCVAHWVGEFADRRNWYESARETMHIHFFTDVEKMKQYLNVIEQE